jgi:hypothetical protein
MIRLRCQFAHQRIGTPRTAARSGGSMDAVCPSAAVPRADGAGRGRSRQSTPSPLSTPGCTRRASPRCPGSLVRTPQCPVTSSATIVSGRTAPARRIRAHDPRSSSRRHPFASPFRRASGQTSWVICRSFTSPVSQLLTAKPRWTTILLLQVRDVSALPSVEGGQIGTRVNLQPAEARAVKWQATRRSRRASTRSNSSENVTVRAARAATPLKLAVNVLNNYFAAATSRRTLP